MPKLLSNFSFFTFFLLFSIQLKAQTYNVPVDEVKTVRGLTAVLKNNPADSACTLMGYNLLVIPITGNPYQIKSMGKGDGVASLKAKLSQLQTGDFMQVSNVLIQCRNEKVIREMRSVSFNLR